MMTQQWISFPPCPAAPSRLSPRCPPQNQRESSKLFSFVLRVSPQLVQENKNSWATYREDFILPFFLFMSHLVGVLGLQVLFTPTLGGAAAASARTCKRLVLALLSGVASHPPDLQGYLGESYQKQGFNFPVHLSIVWETKQNIWQ